MEYYDLGKTAKRIEKILIIVKGVITLIWIAVWILHIVCSDDITKRIFDLSFLTYGAIVLLVSIFKRYKASKFITKDLCGHCIDINYEDANGWLNARKYVKSYMDLSETKEFWRTRYEREKIDVVKAEAYCSMLFAVCIIIYAVF